MTCTSTLAWQPSFESNFFSPKICICSTKKVLFFFLLIEFLVHLIKHYFINTLRGSLVPPWLRSCAWQNFCHVFFRPDSWTSQEVFWPFSTALISRISGRDFLWNFAERFQNRTIERNTAYLLQTPKHTDLDKEVLFVSPVGTSGGDPWNANITTAFKTKEAKRGR